LAISGTVASDVWIGLNDIQDDNMFEWANRAEVLFTNWNANQPRHLPNTNEDCVMMKLQVGKVYSFI
jgi:hypothetical protein